MKKIINSPCIIVAKGEAAKMINEDMKNPDINKDIMKKCKEIVDNNNISTRRAKGTKLFISKDLCYKYED